MRYVLTLLLLFVHFSVYAQDDLVSVTREISSIERVVQKARKGEKELTEYSKRLPDIKLKLQEWSGGIAKQLEKNKQDISSLGAEVKNEPIAVVSKRKQLLTDKDNLEKQLATIRVLLLRVDDLAKEVNNQLKRLLKARLLDRSSNIYVLLKEYWGQRASWWSSTTDFIKKNFVLRGFDSGTYSLFLSILMSVFLIAYLLKRYLYLWIGSCQWGESFSSRFLCTFISALSKNLPRLLTSTALAVTFYYVSEKEQGFLIEWVIYGLPFYFIAIGLIEWLLVPVGPVRAILPIPSDTGRLIANRLYVLSLLVFIGVLIFSSPVMNELTEPVFLILRSVFALVLVINLIWVVRLFGRLELSGLASALRVVIIPILLVVLVAELIGFRNLSSSLLRVSFSVLLILGVFSMLQSLLHDVFTGIEKGSHPVFRALRNGMGLKVGQQASWLLWLRLLILLMMWILLGLALTQLLDISDQLLNNIQSGFSSGFTVGSLKIVPARIILAIAVFVLLYMLSSWLKTRMEKHWLVRTSMDRGAREAMVTLVGYVGVSIAVLVGLGTSGFAFTNLAIIAGALSVGIGFGLQNIVNNFVSGLILLFERPVKTGDWIVVGNTEGYVKRIRIRTTQIQTFDRADVIVPNSDLISNQVTNWMLYDQRGRVKVKVGVAYGSDTKKVKEILTEVANAHEEVVKGNDELKITVLFHGFGDSSLDFELRCFIRNIDNRLQVVSDLNFAIDDAFRKNGVEIPFPQRDLHVRSISENVASSVNPATKKPSPAEGDTE